MPTGAFPVADDDELVRQIASGDEVAFQALIDRHARYLYGIAHGLAGNTADAEDLVQETFTGVLRSRFRGEASVRTWLVQILVRRAGMLRRWRRRKGGHRSLDATAAGEAAERPPGSAGFFTGVDARLDLAIMLRTLSREHRAVIVLREVEGMTYAEIATVLGVPRGTVESRLHRAREELRQRFKGYM